MASGYKINKWQQSRAPQMQIVSDDIENMADAGELPKGLVGRATKKFETEDFTATLGFDSEHKQWVFKRINNDTGEVLNLRGSREDISDGLALERTLLQKEVNDLIEEQETTNPDYMCGERLECWNWLQTPHGREYSTIAHERVWLMLQARLAQLGHLPITVANLEKAYCDLLDMTPCPLDHWFAKRDARLAQEAKEAEEAAAIPVAATPHENLGPSEEVLDRQKQDAENRRIAKGTSASTALVTKQGLAKLKRLAIDSRYAKEHRS